MTEIRNKSLMLLAAIGVACSGCHNGSDWEPSEPESPISDPKMLTLNLNVGCDVNGSDIATRADKGDTDGYGPAQGEMEKISSLRVIIVRDVMETKEAGAWGTVEANRVVATSAEGYPLRDNLEFEVIANEKKRIYLIANESSITSWPGDFSSVGAFLNSYSAKERVKLNLLADWIIKNPVESNENDTTHMGLFADVREGVTPRIPLTECFNITTSCDSTNLDNINPDNLYYSQMFVTRTAAKATFIVDQENSSPVYDDVKITAVALSGIGSEEYVFPRDTEYSNGKDNTNVKYPNGDNLLGMISAWNRPSSDAFNMYIKKFSTPTGSKPLTYVKEGLEIPIVNEDAGENTQREIFGPVYFPESILDKDKNYQVSVQLSTGVWLTADLTDSEQAPAVESNILNIDGHDAIARNTHLKITFRFTPQELVAEVAVVPYIGIDLTPGFGFEQLLPGDHNQPTDW